MEIQAFGANMLTLTTKKLSLVIDPYIYGAKLPREAIKKAFLAVFTQEWEGNTLESDDMFIINSPGEYEVKSLDIKGMATKLHSDDPSGFAKGIIYKIEIGGYKVAVLGHTAAPLSDEQIDFLGTVDILSLPVGGNGYSLEKDEAAKIARDLEPKIIIPTHWSSKGIDYPVLQDNYEKFVEELGLPSENLDKLKIKGLLPESSRVVILEV